MTELAADPGAELAAALAAVQAELPEVKKTRTAKVEKDGRLLYTYDYADLSDVSDAVLPILGKHGLSFTAFPGHSDGKFGLRYYLLHSSGARLEGFYELDDKGGMQVVGGRLTYVRRYVLCAVTGVAAEEDVDARGDSQSRTVQRRQPSGSGQQPQSTAQRRPRTQTSPPAASDTPRSGSPAAPPADVAAAGGDLTPLPGEEEITAPVPGGNAREAEASKAGSPGPGRPDGAPYEPYEPDTTDYDTPGTATRGKGGQLTALWAVLSAEFGFTGTEESKAQARAVCEHIINRDLGGTTGNLSRNEARTVLDTLAHWQYQAAKEGRAPRDYMLALMVAQDGGGDA